VAGCFKQDRVQAEPSTRRSNATAVASHLAREGGAQLIRRALLFVLLAECRLPLITAALPKGQIRRQPAGYASNRALQNFRFRGHVRTNPSLGLALGTENPDVPGTPLAWVGSLSSARHAPSPPNVRQSTTLRLRETAAATIAAQIDLSVVAVQCELSSSAMSRSAASA